MLRLNYILCYKKIEMARQMYTYTLQILEKVSFDLDLFHAELKKAIQNLLPHEIAELEVWIQQFIFVNPHLEPAKAILHNNN